MHVYEAVGGSLSGCFQVFDGVRVHGITSTWVGRERLMISVHGDRVVKVEAFEFDSLVENQVLPG